MFGFLKKSTTINTKESTDKCLVYLLTLPFEIQRDVSEKMLECLKLHVNGKLGTSPADFFNAMQQAKQDCMRRNRLNSHEHPEFAFLQLLEDSVLSESPKGQPPGYSWQATKSFILQYLPIVKKVTEAPQIFEQINWKR